MSQSEAKLQSEILKAHKDNDYSRLCELYAKAAQTRGDVNQACFLATQAYVFGLQSNHSLTEHLHSFLKNHGREE